MISTDAVLRRLPLDKILLPIARARTFGFALQYVGFDYLVGLLPGTERVRRARSPEILKALAVQIDELHREDLKLFTEGVLPLRSLWTTPVLPPFTEARDALIDGYRVYRRRKNRKHNDLKVSADPGDYPEYYLRNFHFQTDGYFSADSARRYDRQVDLLFTGTADAMRRSWIRPLLAVPEWKRKIANGGKGLRILEIACGPGSASLSLARLFPKAEITLQDLSASYVNVARERLGSVPNVKWSVGNAEELEFKDGRFDLVLCVYLFHELPRKARQNVIDEAARVLKKGGIFIGVDALQQGDSPRMDPLLGDFPRNYHEPFFMDYVKTPLRKMATAARLKTVDEGVAFASKYLLAAKPAR